MEEHTDQLICHIRLRPAGSPAEVGRGVEAHILPFRPPLEPGLPPQLAASIPSSQFASTLSAAAKALTSKSKAHRIPVSIFAIPTRSSCTPSLASLPESWSWVSGGECSVRASLTRLPTMLRLCRFLGPAAIVHSVPERQPESVPLTNNANAATSGLY